MDKNGKLWGKISIIDLMAVVLVLVVAAGSVYRFTSSSTRVDKGNAKLVYTLKINGVRDFTVPYYQEGLKCYDKKTSQYIGVIKSVRQEPYFAYAEAPDGTVISAAQPNIVEIYVDIEANGNVMEEENAYFAEGRYEIKVGSEVYLNFKYIDVMGIVNAISVQTKY